MQALHLLLERKGIGIMNEKSKSDSYAAAGVDITAGYKAVELMKKHIARTMVGGKSADIGGFGGLFELDITDMPNPVLFSGTDGVGTKLKMAFLMDKHDTVGIDCVAMCVNDIICCGAKPLFFLDYIACGKNYPEKIAEIVSGIAEGCVQSGCELIGGETAEMPGFYDEDEYDLAGFSVGAVDKAKVLDKNKMKPGDVIIGLASSGVHSNGFSLVRKVFDVEKADLKASVKILPIFDLIAEEGNIPEHDMFNTFNMGVGMSVVVAAEDAEKALNILRDAGEDAYVIGEIIKSDEKVVIC